jgi:ankyrin repeat protein
VPRRGRPAGGGDAPGAGQVHAGDSNNFDFTPLHHAAYNNHWELCEVLVREHGAAVNRDSIGGETALHAAVQGNATEALVTLLRLAPLPLVLTGHVSSFPPY